VLFIGFFWFSRVRLLAPLSRIREAMTRLAQGERSVEVPETDRGDEIGEMAEAFRVFKKTAFEAERLAVERQQILEALRSNEQRLKDIAEATSDWFWEMDADLRFTYFSKNFDERSGLGHSGIIGKRRDEIPGIDIDGEPENWRRHLADLEAHRPFRDFVYRTVTEDGRAHYMRTSGKPTFDKKGSFLGYRGSTTDISAEVEARTQAERLEARLAETIRRIPEGYTLYSKDDRLVLWNDRMREFFPEMADRWKPGTPYEDIARDLIECGVFHLGNRSPEIALREAMRLHRQSGSTAELHLADGRWLQVAKHRTDDGGSVGIWTDITEIKRREAALSLLLMRPAGDDAFLERAVEAISLGLGYRWAGIGRFSENGETIDLQAFWKNGSSAETFSIPLNDGPCKKVAEKQGYVFYPDHLREHFPDFAPLKNSEAVCYRGNILLDEQNRPLGCVFATNDQPDRREGEAETLFRLIANWVRYELQRREAEASLRGAKERAETANHAKSEFLANMSHELRTPLNAILGFSEVLENEYLGPLGNPKYQEYAMDIRESGNRLLGLINNVLDLSRLADGTIELNEEVVDIGKMIKAALKEVGEPAEHNGVALANDAAPGISALRADPHRISQILLNLLLNAIKFTPEGGKVTVFCRTEADGGISFSVSDTGIGMSKEEIAKALETFGQAEGSYARKYEGAGLGLPLVASLVDLHGGSLEIASEKDKGTAVTVHFPPVRSVPADRSPRPAGNRTAEPAAGPASEAPGEREDETAPGP
jgi:PAS domain S-box-containing protein